MKATSKLGFIELSNINGECSSHPNPDLWFSDITSSNGKLSPIAWKRYLSRVELALAICEGCPMKQACLDEGCKPENLEHGIWGGKLPGERILMSGAPSKSTRRQSFISMAEKVRGELLS